MPGAPRDYNAAVRRRIAIIIVFLLLGAIVNIAVAWGLGLWFFNLEEVIEARVAAVSDAEGWVVESDRHEGFGSTSYTAMWWRSEDYRQQVASDLHPSDLLPRWLGFDEPDAAFVQGKLDFDIRYGLSRGWPLRALACLVYPDDDADPPLRSAMAINAGFTSDLKARLLPLRPLFPGFIINTLFYALLLWLLFFVPFAARRMIRRRRGQCAKCAYPIGVSPICTECGAAIATSLRRSAGM